MSLAHQHPQILPFVTPRQGSAPPFISVIVPVRNEEAFIESTLRQLLAQDYHADRFEILVADGCSTDRTREIVADLQTHFPQATLLDNPGRLSSAGRNVAVEASRGDLIVLVDGHCEIDNPHYLADIADAFSRSGADCLGRPQPLDVSQATPLQRAIAIARSSRLGHHPASHIYSGNEGFVARRRASRSRIAAMCSTSSALSTNHSTPARTWSSTTGSRKQECVVSSRRACKFATSRVRRCRAYSVR